MTQEQIVQRVIDRLTWDDPATTFNADIHTHNCSERSPSGYWCTRKPGHAGKHHAHSGPGKNGVCSGENAIW